MLYREQVENLYKAERDNSPMLPRMLKIFGGKIYDAVLREVCGYDKDGTRYFVSGGTPALKVACDAFEKFVKEYESTGTVSMVTFDCVIWACHNNGTFADKFIHSPYCGDEAEADIIGFLNKLSGTYR